MPNYTRMPNHTWMCKITCQSCGEVFEVHPQANALAPNAYLCNACIYVKEQMKEKQQEPWMWLQ